MTFDFYREAIFPREGVKEEVEDRGPVAVTAHCSLILCGPGPPHSKSGHSREPRMSQLTPNEARIESHMAPGTQSETLMKQCLWSEMILHHTCMYVNTALTVYTLCHVTQIPEKDKDKHL